MNRKKITKTEHWSCNWFECKNYDKGKCSADSRHVFRYLSNCPEFDPIEPDDYPDFEELPF